MTKVFDDLLQYLGHKHLKQRKPKSGTHRSIPIGVKCLITNLLLLIEDQNQRCVAEPGDGNQQKAREAFLVLRVVPLEFGRNIKQWESNYRVHQHDNYGWTIGS